MRVILRVNQSTWDDIAHRVRQGGQGDRIDSSRRHIDMVEIVLQPENPFGYPSDEPCRVCAAHKDNQSEPRFGYTVCSDHQNVPPASLDAAAATWRAVHGSAS